MQLVGLACGRCSGRIASVLDGCFCEACGVPVHRECVVPAASGPGLCPACGCDPAIGAAYRAKGQRDDAETASALRMHHLFWACLELAAALPVFAYLALRLVPFKRLLFDEDGSWGVPGARDAAVLVLGAGLLARSFSHFRGLRKLSRKT